MTPEAVIFDFDFTLADSSCGIVECVNSALHQLGFQPVPAAKIVGTIGLPLKETFNQLTGEVNGELSKRFAESFHARADQVMDKSTVVYDFVRPVMLSLHDANVRTAIVSTKLNHRIKGILAANNLSDLFDLIVGADDVVNPKPDPEGLLLALRMLGIDSESAVYVGDHAIDAQAAVAAKIPFIAVLSGKHTRTAFEQYPHKAILESVRDLAQILLPSQGDPDRLPEIQSSQNVASRGD
jgi:phosphoglycolate phosphatase